MAWIFWTGKLDQGHTGLEHSGSVSKVQGKKFNIPLLVLLDLATPLGRPLKSGGGDDAEAEIITARMPTTTARRPAMAKI